MAGTASRLLGVGILLLVFLVGAAGPAGAHDPAGRKCWTVGTDEPDGVPRFVTICAPATGTC